MSKEIPARYFLAFPLEGEGADWHRRFSAWAAERFGVADVARRVPPHLTAVPPFTAPSDEAARAWGQEAAEFLMPFAALLGGFGVFSSAGRGGGGVLYAAICGTQPREAAAAVVRTQEYVAAHAPVSWRPRPWTPHATLAYGTRVCTAPAMRRLLLKEAPEAQRTFPLDISSAVLYRKEAPSTPWRAHGTFPLSTQGCMREAARVYGEGEARYY